MNTEAKRALRLIEALEALAGEEELGARQGARQFAAVQYRAAPLVEDLSRLAGHPAVAALRPRVQALVQRRQASVDSISSRMATVKARLAILAESTVQLKRLAPAYGPIVVVPTRLAETV